MANINEIKRFRGGDLVIAAQANVQIDAEIGQKEHFRKEIGIIFHFHFNLLTKACSPPAHGCRVFDTLCLKVNTTSLPPLHEGGTL